jgi:hypothetical protein
LEGEEVVGFVEGTKVGFLEGAVVTVAAEKLVGLVQPGGFEHWPFPFTTPQYPMQQSPFAVYEEKTR